MNYYKNPLPIPNHFQKHKVSEIWKVPYLDHSLSAEKWAIEHKISPSHQDHQKVCLLIIDPQITFCIPGSELYVGGRSGMGAVEDNQRLCVFIYKNLHKITDIIVTMDTHTTHQIFHPIFLINNKGEHPTPGTMITTEDIENNLWRVNPTLSYTNYSYTEQELQKYLIHYSKTLTQTGKYSLITWPYHSILGGIGHAIVPAVEEAIFFHAIARQNPYHIELKGMNPLTENYSILKPEVMTDHLGKPIDKLNQILVNRLLNYDKLIITGQAKSHCVSWTIEDLYQQINKKDPSLTNKIYLLNDCSSPVVIPNIIDFAESAERSYQSFSDKGFHVVNSHELSL